MNTVTRLETLRTREHTATVDIIEAVLELKESGEYLALGYSSIWDFLVRHLKYSNAAASRRYKAMKCAAQFPQVLAMLREHRTTLSALAQAEATLFKTEKPEQLLAEIDGRPAREVERAVARRNPAKAKRESVRRKYVRRPVARASDDDGLFRAGEDEPASNASSPTSDETLERVLISFSLSPDDFEDFERVKAILSRKHPQGLTVELAFRELMAFFLKHKAPKPPRRKTRTRSGKPRKQLPKSPAACPNNPRYVSRRLRDQVHGRDGGRCTYRGPGGRRCGSTHDLQIDHIQPVAAAGVATLDNLRLLCAAHNRWRTRDLLPTRKSAPRIEPRQPQSSP